MSDKVFFLRFKDHCTTLNMFVTFFPLMLGDYHGLHKNFIGSGSPTEEGEGGREKSIPIYLSQVPFKGNK